MFTLLGPLGFDKGPNLQNRELAIPEPELDVGRHGFTEITPQGREPSWGVVRKLNQRLDLAGLQNPPSSAHRKLHHATFAAQYPAVRRCRGRKKSRFAAIGIDQERLRRLAIDRTAHSTVP